MKRENYIDLLKSFYKNNEFDFNIISEYLKDIDKDFNFNEFMRARQLLNDPFFVMENTRLHDKYSGVDFDSVMIEKCIDYFNKKFEISEDDIQAYKLRYMLDISNTKDISYRKKLQNRFGNNIFVVNQ